MIKPALVKKKMLFVDDRTKRIHYALNNFPDYEVTIATCVPEALRLLVRDKWDVVSLDHDLNGYDFQDPDTPTCGMEIVRYIEKCGWPSGHVQPDMRLHPPEIIIHSSNIFAAHLMVTRLSAIGLRAFWKKITYPVENMKYGVDGLPNLGVKTDKFPVSENWHGVVISRCWRCGENVLRNQDNICHSCWDGMRTGKLSNP